MYTIKRLRFADILNTYVEFINKVYEDDKPFRKIGFLLVIDNHEPDQISEETLELRPYNYIARADNFDGYYYDGMGYKFTISEEKKIDILRFLYHTYKKEHIYGIMLDV